MSVYVNFQWPTKVLNNVNLRKFPVVCEYFD